jgi:hypothetical protein
MNHILVVEEWTTVKIPTLMAASIDKFLQTNIAKQNGISSRADLIIRLVSKFLADYEKEYGLFANRKIARQVNGADIAQPIE